MTIRQPALFRGDVFSSGDYGHVALFDDFLGSAVTYNRTSAPWASYIGSATVAADDPIDWKVVAGANGRCEGIPGSDSDGEFASNGIQLVSKMDYRSVWGNLALECYLEIEDVADLLLFIGFTTFTGVPEIQLQIPFEGTGSGNMIQANSTNAVGLLIDAKMTSNNFWGVAISSLPGRVVISEELTGVSPSNATPTRYRVEVNNTISTAPTALFYENGVRVGGALAADGVNPAGQMSPIIAAGRRNNAPMIQDKSVSVDWIYVQTDRLPIIPDT